jgi:hypothetical protein
VLCGDEEILRLLVSLGGDISVKNWRVRERNRGLAPNYPRNLHMLESLPKDERALNFASTGDMVDVLVALGSDPKSSGWVRS